MGDLVFPCSAQEICKRRAFILHSLCAMDAGFSNVPVCSVYQKTLDAMLKLYDDMFLGGTLLRAFSSLRVTLSFRLISAAGKFVYAKSPDHRISKTEIRMSGDFLMRLEQGPFTLNGLSVSTPQEAFLLVFEHELCHALETALYGETGHSARFRLLTKQLFGHTATTHQLPTRKSEAAQSGIRVGARCTFPYQDKLLKGQITYVGKTATVMVQSATGEYKDARGRRYTKYRVPLKILRIL